MLDIQYGRILELATQEADHNTELELERVILSSARFTRNLVAGVVPNQSMA